jgi:hypothetical protein
MLRHLSHMQRSTLGALIGVASLLACSSTDDAASNGASGSASGGNASAGPRQHVHTGTRAYVVSRRRR